MDILSRSRTSKSATAAWGRTDWVVAGGKGSLVAKGLLVTGSFSMRPWKPLDCLRSRM
jgi:hypothetical protein